MRFAVKRLSASDLTVLSTHHGVVSKTNQKGINLDHNPFDRIIYPLLGKLYDEHKAKLDQRRISGSKSPKPKGPAFPVGLLVGGPNGHAPVASDHHIGVYDKNWRLNGAFIRPPANEPALYADLEEGDFALLVFSGEAVPENVGLLWIRQAGGGADPALHAALKTLIGTSSMRALTEQAIRTAIAPLALDAGHAIFALLPDEAFETAVAAAVEAGPKEISKVASSPRVVTAETLAKIQQAREINGRMGEELVNAYLSGLKGLTVDWVSSRNTFAPLDFRTTDGASGAATSLDVKTTTGTHKTTFHLSAGELEEAAGSADPYFIYRVSELEGGEALLRISDDIRPFARDVLTSLKSLPPGAAPASFVIEPDEWGVGWGPPVRLRKPDV